MVATAQHSCPSENTGRSSVAIRPGVEMPDWSQISSPQAEAALGAILEIFHFDDCFRKFDATVDLVRCTLLTLYGELGRAPSSVEIAMAAGLEQDQIESALAALRRRDLVVLDEQSGAVKGAYPFTERETGHRIKFAGTTLNAMCAVDALGAGAMFASDCEIKSSCRQCGAPVSVTTADKGERLSAVVPQTSMVWNGIHYEGQAANSLCTVIALFCSPAHLEQWLEAREGSKGFRLSVDEAMQVGKALFRPVLAEGRKHRMIELNSTITCPECAAQTKEEMPTDSCLFFYECPDCKTRLKPLAGDCCVFCSYGDVKCPPIQQGDGCCVA